MDYLHKRPGLERMADGMTAKQKDCVRREMSKLENDPSRPNIGEAAAENVIGACKA